MNCQARILIIYEVVTVVYRNYLSIS